MKIQELIEKFEARELDAANNHDTNFKRFIETEKSDFETLASYYEGQEKAYHDVIEWLRILENQEEE